MSEKAGSLKDTRCRPTPLLAEAECVLIARKHPATRSVKARTWDGSLLLCTGHSDAELGKTRIHVIVGSGSGMLIFFILIVGIGVASVIGYKIDSERHSLNMDGFPSKKRNPVRVPVLNDPDECGDQPFPALPYTSRKDSSYAARSELPKDSRKTRLATGSPGAHGETPIRASLLAS